MAVCTGQTVMQGVPAVAAYCRVSTEKEDQLHSLQAQQEFFQQYAMRCGYDLVELYTDEGISGTQLKRRRGFQRMMEDAERGRFSKVFVKDVSRLARNVVDFLQSIRRLKLLGIDCQFITSNMSSNDGELTLTIMAAVAQEESANLSKRIKFGKAKNAAAGRVPNVLYGYDKIPGEYFTLHINEAEAQVVRRIFSMYVQDGLGEKRIAQVLNAEGVPTKRGCRWQQESISRLLRHQLYVGQVVNGREVVQDFLTGQRQKQQPEQWMVTHRPELAIVPQELFVQAQRQMAQRRVPQLSHSHAQGKYPFSTLLRCGACGYHFRRITRTYRNTYHRWVCSGHNALGQQHCASRACLDEGVLQEKLLHWLRAQIRAPHLLLEKTLQQLQNKCQSQLEHSQHSAERMQRLRHMRQKQLHMFEMDVISAQELQQRVACIDAQLHQCLGADGQGDGLEKQIRDICSDITSLLSPVYLDNLFWKSLLQEICVEQDGRVCVSVRDFGRNREQSP